MHTVYAHNIEWCTDTIRRCWCGSHNHMQSNYCASEYMCVPVCVRLFDEHNIQQTDGIVVQLFLPAAASSSSTFEPTYSRRNPR